VAISDPATANFTALKNLGNRSIALKNQGTQTHTHLETLKAREKTQVAISDSYSQTTTRKWGQNTIIKYKRTHNGAQKNTIRINVIYEVNI
jgi:hypothetical protein